MLPTAIVMFREVLEAALVVGIVVAATKGVAGRGLWVWLGLICGAMGAALVAAFAATISAMAAGMGQELFNAAILFAAVVMLGWHNVWMGRHSRAIGRRLETVGKDVEAGRRPLAALAIVIALALLREGSEAVLFVFGIAAAGEAHTGTMLAGGLLGLAAGVAVGFAMYHGLVRIPIRHLFRVTAWLIVLLAAGMAAQGAGFLLQAGVLPSMGGALWDTSWLLSESSLLGRVLHTLIGYVAQPDGVQLIFYGATLLAIAGLMRLAARQPARRAVA
jgi:high-affinity iron transporter